jgi:hypothetical protein
MHTIMRFMVSMTTLVALFAVAASSVAATTTTTIAPDFWRIAGYVVALAAVLVGLFLAVRGTRSMR